MAKTDTLQGALDLLILKVLSRETPLHGYAIMMAIIALSGEVLRVEEGSLYPALHRLEEGGFIKGAWITRDTGRRSRVYQLTAAGRKRLPAETERWAEVSAAIQQVLRTA
ncbi:MAG: PadR family transcriptional regulator [Bryobacterales bacterium]|nr:PadR family transcriptional regulator [Bryobacterales bacterium]